MKMVIKGLNSHATFKVTTEGEGNDYDYQIEATGGQFDSVFIEKTEGGFILNFSGQQEAIEFVEAVAAGFWGVLKRSDTSTEILSWEK